MTKKRELVTGCAVALVLGWVWIVSYGLPLGVSVVVLGLPVVLGVLSVLWGE